MAKIHGDFGDMTRYDLEIRPGAAWLVLLCQDCDRAIDEWHLEAVSLAEINRVAAEHETKEEQT